MAAHHDGVPPPLQDLPSAKEKKYDRQLRLWGAAGQVALEESHIVLFNNGPGVTGVETLKNLVLPGIGQFTIVDSAVVSEADLGVNFFLDDASLGKFRAEETVKMLMELNPGVQGHAVTEPLETLINNDKLLQPYNLVLVAAPIDPSILSLIEKHATQTRSPVFYTHSVGFYSQFSISLPSRFPIVDTHPDPTATTDLRLLKPWPELSKFAKEKTMGMESMSQHDKAHIPWVCLLLHYLEVWKQVHDGQVPADYKQKSEFRDLVRSGDPHEENFDEACAATLKSLNSLEPLSSVLEILSSPEKEDLNHGWPHFWIIADAVHQFYETHGVLPLPGAVPDMKARSTDYIALQNIYKNKARADCAEVLSLVRELEHSTSIKPKLPPVDEKEVENFCKGAAHIHLVHGKGLQIPQVESRHSSLPNRHYSFGKSAAALAMEPTNPMGSLIGLYIAFLAWDEYIATHTTPASDLGGQGLKIPGSILSEIPTDTEKLAGIAHQILDNIINEAGTRVQDPEYTNVKAEIGNICVEMVRAGGAELHNIAALTGGLVAQEVIKVITRQYVPVDNTCVFDGIASKTQVFRA